MKRIFIHTLLAVACFYAGASQAVKRDNYVVFNVKGDCNQEDCIALTKNSLKSFSADIVALDVVALAPHQTVDYKPVIITFKNLKTAPYQRIMQLLTALGYQAVSYVIHDTHAGNDVILPH